MIVTANKLKEKRSQAPIAISILSPKLIEETKAQRIDALLNKVSGVYMPTIGGTTYDVHTTTHFTKRVVLIFRGWHAYQNQWFI